MSDNHSYTLKPVEQEITLDGVPYLLREPSEAVIADYRAELLGTGELVNGAFKLSPAAQRRDEVLLAGCLFKSVNDDARQLTEWAPVTREFVQRMPHRVFVELLKWVKEHGGEEEQTKEGLDKQIEALEKLREMKKAGDVTLGNLRGAGPGTSAWRENSESRSTN
jgi:hypothetical protein